MAQFWHHFTLFLIYFFYHSKSGFNLVFSKCVLLSKKVETHQKSSLPLPKMILMAVPSMKYLLHFCHSTRCNDGYKEDQTLWLCWHFTYICHFYIDFVGHGLKYKTIVQYKYERFNLSLKYIYGAIKPNWHSPVRILSNVFYWDCFQMT